MRAFSQKRNQSQDSVSSKLAGPNGAIQGRDPHELPVRLLQRTIGNQAALRLLSQGADSLTGSPSAAFPKQESDRARPPAPVSAFIEPNLVIGRVEDPLEQEANRVADAVIRMPAPESFLNRAAPPSSDAVAQKATGGQASALMARQATTSEPASRGVPSVVHEALRSSGQPLDASARAYFEPRFGQDFSRVRVHRDEKAIRSAEAIDALAYTVGANIVFGRGLYTPETQAGRHLLAHELTHVVQGAANPTVVRRMPRMGSKSLTKGMMTWFLTLAEAKQTATGKNEETRKDIGDATYARMQIRFLPNAAYKGKTVTFLQTVLQPKENSVALLRWLAGTSGLKPRIDVADSDFDPFYGADFATKNQRWEPEGAPPGHQNAPSSAQDPWASMYDEPVVSKSPGYETSVKLFESVAVVAETGEMLGVLRWGIGDDQLYGAEAKDCTDAPSADFGDALKRFHATPKSLGSGNGQERYHAIVDGFVANDGVAATGPYGMVFSPLQKAAILTADQEKKLEPLITWAKELSKTTAKMKIVVGGFADPTEKDVYATSEQRAQAVQKYLVSEGIPSSVIIDALPFAAAWSLAPPGVNEGRNRRVQIRVSFLD